MREIEVKARLTDKAAFLREAKKQGIVFGQVVVQEDTTYEIDLPYADPQWSIFRLRKQNDTFILTMKHKASARSRDNHEYETIVDKDEQVIMMLNRLGFMHGVRLRKQRRIAHQGGLELCLDEIDDLGSFVEAEKLVNDDADVDVVQAELWDVLTGLGISSADRVHHGYDTLMRQAMAGKELS